MSTLGNARLEDYEKLAAKLKTYEGAESFAIKEIAPITNGISDYIYPTGFYVIAILALGFWLLRMRVQNAVRYLFYLFVISVLMIPVTTDQGVKLPWLPYYTNALTTAVLGGLQDVVDSVIKTGAPRNFAAPMHPLSLYAVAGRQDIRDTALARTLATYRDRCSPSAGNTMSRQELRSVGLMGGPIGVDTAEAKKVRAAALSKLERLPESLPLWADGSGFYKGGYLVESKASWQSRNGNPGLAPGYLKNTDPALKNAEDPDEYLFFPKTCRDLYRITDLAAREYLGMLNDRHKEAVTTAGLGADKERDGMVLLGAQLTAANNLNEASEDKSKDSGFMASLGGVAGKIVGGIESALVAVAMKLVTWVSELATKWLTSLIPGLVALLVAFSFVLYPVVLLLSLVPGRESSVSTWVFSNVFLKLYLFLAYLILKVGGLLFTQAVDSFARSGGDTNFAAITLGGGLITALAVIWGAPKIAYGIVFSQHHGLAGALGFGAIGGAQVQRATGQVAGRIVNAIPSARSSSATTKNAHSLSPKQGMTPSADAVSPNSTSGRGRTLKAVSDRVSQEPEKK